MKYDLKANPFDKIMMTGVFIGLIITVIAMAFDAAFLESTDYPFTTFINVSSLIFSLNILFMALAAIYYGFTKLSKYGSIMFIVFFALLTIFLLIKVAGVHRSDNQHFNSEFKMVLSVIILMVAAGAFGIPFLVNNKWFRRDVI